MNRKEQIYLKSFRTGTTMYLFSDKLIQLKPNFPRTEIYPSYVTLNTLNQPTGLYFESGDTLYHLIQDGTNNLYYNVPLSAVVGSNYVTGGTIIAVSNTSLSPANIQLKQNIFEQSISALTNGAYTNYYFNKTEEIDDFYVDIGIKRSFGTLDTLKIYNNPVNSIPTQEAKTGVVFGRLVAVQNLKNDNGDFIKIPLKNVPIGIFNPSETYPTSFSVNENGERITLNLKESALPSEYFNTDSYTDDVNNYLRSGSGFTTVPPEFKYITKTNDNGEFIIYNAPTGSQNIIFEVDLFKQGLTKDEIALNNFPFPVNNDENIDKIPSFFFRQVPVEVVPAWGLGQTGYTEVNINANIDLRKWATYIFPPVGFYGRKLEQAVAANAANSLKIEIRDMTQPLNKIRRPSRVAVVPNDLDRQEGAEYLWFNELSQSRNKLEFYQFGCHVIKLQANLYDPEGYQTDKNGNATSNKGVWLAAYQFNMYIKKDVSTRKTGAIREWVGAINGIHTLSHFDLSYAASNANVADDAPDKIGEFPYEKPWTINYPTRYNIPAKPTSVRISGISGRAVYGTVGSTTIYYTEDPTYADGDLVGTQVWGLGVGGFGVQQYNGVWFPNRISHVATKGYMYKYERGVAYNESYANGYEPYWGPSTNRPFNGSSNVLNGEKYQRLECGYGYFLKPQGWPRLIQELWYSDTPYYPDYEIGFGSNTYGDPNNPGPGVSAAGVRYGFYSPYSHPNDIYNFDNQNFALSLDTRNNIKNGTIDIYRIIDSGTDNITTPESFVIPTFARLECKQASRCSSYGSGNGAAWRLSHQGSFKVKAQFYFNGSVICNDGNGNIYNPYINGQVIDFYPGGEFFSPNAVTISYVGLNLPGNASFDFLTNKYTAAVYRFEANIVRRNNVNNGGSSTQSWYYGNTFSLPAQSSGWGTWYVNMEGTGGGNGVVHRGLSDDFNYGGSTYYWDSSVGGDKENPWAIRIDTTDPTTYNGYYL